MLSSLRPIPVLVLCAFSIGCSSKKPASPVRLSSTFTRIPVDTVMTSADLSGIAKTIRYIPLETNEQNMIGKVDKLSFYDGNYFVLDKTVAKCLFVFDKTGKLLYHIKAQRSASSNPSSPSVITDFGIDKANRQVYVYDGEESRLFCFTAGNGDFQKSTPLRGYFLAMALCGTKDIALLRDGMTSYGDEYRNRVCLFDAGGQLQKTWLDRPINPFVDAGGIVCNESFAGNGVLIGRTFCDTLYALENGELTALYKIDAGGHPLPKGMLSTKDKDQFREMMEAPNTSYVTDNIFDTHRYLAFFYKVQEYICLVMREKSSKKTVVIKNFNNDIDNIALNFMVYMDDSCFISVLPPADLQQQYHLASSQTGFLTKYRPLIELNGEITQDSNPVIALVTLK